MSSDRAVRAARRARRSSLPARVISGASLDVSLALESDDDDFFGDNFESDAESVPLSGPESPAPGLIQRDSNSGCEGDDVSSDSDNSSAEAVATPPSTDDQILAKMNTGCGCQKNHFAPLSLENYKSLRQQFTGASLQHRDSYLLGVLSAGLRSTSEKTQTGSVRTRQSFMYHVHGHKVCITVFKR